MARKTPTACALLLCLLAAAAVARGPSRADSVANVQAFARLYGYVRFFHPSDEASSIDWDRFAVYGTGRVAGCADAKALRRTLAALFGPMAPTVQVYGAGAPVRALKLPGDSANCRPVCWQHHGVGLQASSVYHNRRTGRPMAEGLAGQSVVQFVQLPAGDSLTARRIKVRARVRAEDAAAGDEPALLAVGAALHENPEAALERATFAPFSADEWQACEVEAVLEPGHTTVQFGVAAGTEGRAWADDFEAWLGAGDSWTALELADPGFEDSVSLEDSPVWMYLGNAKKSGERPFAGERCLVIEPGMGTPEIPGSPVPGEYVDKPLARGLSCRVPLCLWSRARQTLPRGDSTALEKLRASLSAVSWDTLSDPALGVRLGGVVVAWSVLRHFYPYFDVAPVDWDTVLPGVLGGALADTNRMDFVYTLRRLGHALYDGHASVSDATTRARGSVPARVEVVEDRVAVTASQPGSNLQPGDVVLGIDGRPAADLLSWQVEHSSGSPQFRQARGVLRLLNGKPGDTLELSVERGADTLTVHGVVVPFPSIYLQPDAGDSIRLLEKDIWYVDLNRAPMEAIDPVMDKLATAKGVVFDLRGYPRGNHDVICHLLAGNERRGEKWMFVPQVAWPDFERVTAWDSFGWSYLQPKPPRITGKVVFLTDGTAISYAESFMGHIEGFKLAEIVGGPTAGTNGNVNPMMLPGGFRFSWTGMKVTKFDGSQHHLIGIQPTVPLERTLEAVRAGRDEYIEKALALIRG